MSNETENTMNMENTNLPIDPLEGIEVENAEVTEEVAAEPAVTSIAQIWDRFYAVREELRTTLPVSEDGTKAKSVPKAHTDLADKMAPTASVQAQVNAVIVGIEEYCERSGIKHQIYNPEGKNKRSFIYLSGKTEKTTSLNLMEVVALMEKAYTDYKTANDAAKATDPGLLPEDMDARREFLLSFAEKHGIEASPGHLDAAQMEYTKQLAISQQHAAKAMAAKKRVRDGDWERIFASHKTYLAQNSKMLVTKPANALAADKNVLVSKHIKMLVPDLADFVRLKEKTDAGTSVRDGLYVAQVMNIIGGSAKEASYPTETVVSRWKKLTGSDNAYAKRLTVLSKAPKKGPKGSSHSPIVESLPEQAANKGIEIGNYNTTVDHVDTIRVPFNVISEKLFASWQDDVSHTWPIPGTIEQCESISHLSVEEKFNGAKRIKIADVQRPYVWWSKLPKGWISLQLMDALSIKAGEARKGGTEIEGKVSLPGRFIGDVMKGTPNHNTTSAIAHLTLEVDVDSDIEGEIVDSQQRFTTLALFGAGLMALPITGTDLDLLVFADGTPLAGSGRCFLTEQKLFAEGDIKDAPWEKEGVVYLDKEYPALAANFMNARFAINVYDFTKSDPETWPERRGEIYNKLNGSDFQIAMSPADRFSLRYFVYQERANMVVSMMRDKSIIAMFADSSDSDIKTAVTSAANSIVAPSLLAWVGYLVADAFAILSNGKYKGVTYNSKTMHTEVVRLLASKHLKDDFFNDVSVCIADVMKATGYARNIHRAVNERGELETKVTSAGKQLPVFNDNRVIDAIRGMIKLRMPELELKFDDNGKVVAVEYEGGNLTSIFDQLRDADALNMFWENNLVYRDPYEMYGDQPSADPWYAAVERKEIEDLPGSLVISTIRKAGGVIVPMTVDWQQSSGRNTMKYVLVAANFYRTAWDCFLNRNGTPVYKVWSEPKPDSTDFNEDGEASAEG